MSQIYKAEITAFFENNDDDSCREVTLIYYYVVEGVSEALLKVEEECKRMLSSSDPPWVIFRGVIDRVSLKYIGDVDSCPVIAIPVKEDEIA